MTEDGRFDWKNYDLVEEERRINRSIVKEVTAKAEKRVKEAEEASKNAINIGIEQGIEQGIQKKEKEIVINMQKNSVPIETIAKYTGLTIDSVKEILKKK